MSWRPHTWLAGMVGWGITSGRGSVGVVLSAARLVLSCFTIVCSSESSAFWKDDVVCVRRRASAVNRPPWREWAGRLTAGVPQGRVSAKQMHESIVPLPSETWAWFSDTSNRSNPFDSVSSRR
jgi:hypothetical protein